MKISKTITSLEKLYEKRTILDKQIKELERKIIIDMEKIIISVSTPVSKTDTKNRKSNKEKKPKKTAKVKKEK